MKDGWNTDTIGEKVAAFYIQLAEGRRKLIPYRPFNIFKVPAALFCMYNFRYINPHFIRKQGRNQPKLPTLLMM